MIPSSADYQGLDAPLPEWSEHRAFDRVEDCENYYPGTFDTYQDPEKNWMLATAALGQCIATDDPRFALPKAN